LPLLLTLLALEAWSPAPAAGQLKHEMRMVEGAPLYSVLPLDAIPSIDQPRFVSVSEARAFMHPDEPVLGVVSGDEARCYSTWLLEGHEIVNDSLGGVPIAATW
jgi:hypothetical protein